MHTLKSHANMFVGFDTISIAPWSRVYEHRENPHTHKGYYVDNGKFETERTILGRDFVLRYGFCSFNYGPFEQLAWWTSQYTDYTENALGENRV